MSRDFGARLAAAAAEQGPARYGRIARLLVELALEHPDLIAGTRESDWGPVLLTVICRTDRHDRSNVIQSLALLPSIPQALAPALIEAGAMDLLERTPLPKAHLGSLARQAGPDDLVALAGRPGLDAHVANLIVARGDSRAHAALAANHGAAIGPSCFGALAELAYSDRKLRDALVGRPDLPPHILEKLWPYLALPAKRAALAAAPERLQQRLAKLMGELVAAEEEPKPATPIGPVKRITKAVAA